jgi:large subunit ribosomal protein L23
MNRERLYQVIESPHVSEKATYGADENRQHVFRVARNANKREIRRAVEQIFSVEVERVQVLNVPGKRTRFGTIQGRRSGWRKAIVRLKPGHDIDYAGLEG